MPQIMEMIEVRTDQELNELVATRVMDLKKCEEPGRTLSGRCYVWRDSDGKVVSRGYLPSFTVDRVWEVWTKALGPRTMLIQSEEWGWFVRGDVTVVHDLEQDQRKYLTKEPLGYGTKPGWAICAAALKTRGVEVTFV